MRVMISSGWSALSLICLTYRSTVSRMAVLNFRTDERPERALAELMADGSTTSDAIRQALVDAVRLRRRERCERSHSTCLTTRMTGLRAAVFSPMDTLRAW